MIATNNVQFAHALTPETWKKLLALGKPIYIRNLDRQRSKKRTTLLVSILNDKTALIQPANHPRQEQIDIHNIRVWRSGTVHNPAGGIPAATLDSILQQDPNYNPHSCEEEEDMDAFQFTEEERQKLVVVDKKQLRFYMGTQIKAFTDNLAKAFLYAQDEITNARRSMGHLAKEISRDKYGISEEGLDLITVADAMRLLRDRHRAQQEEKAVKEEPQVIAFPLEAARHATPPKRTSGPVFPSSSLLEVGLPIPLPASFPTINSYQQALQRRNAAVENYNEAEKMRTAAFEEMVAAQKDVDSIVQLTLIAPTAMLQELIASLSSAKEEGRTHTLHLAKSAD